MRKDNGKQVALWLIAAMLAGWALVSGEKAMGSPIALSWVHATVRIENEWGESGTGFLVFRKVNDQGGKIFLVTNKHVVNEAPEKRKIARSLKLYLNIRGGGGEISGASFSVPLAINGKSLFRKHPNPYVDVLAVDITQLINDAPQIDKKWAEYSNFATSDILQKDEITVGEEVLVIGYPLGLAHAHSNSPLVRQGIVATKIGERITLDVVKPSGEIDRVEIPGFLVDSAVVPGSSGSPVVLKPVIGRIVGNSIMMGAANPYLLGIISSTKIAPIKIGTKVFPTLAGLGVVYDASTIQETIEIFFK